ERERHFMGAAALGAMAWDHPKCMVKIDLTPSHAGSFTTADRRQKQKTCERPTGISALDTVADLSLRRPPEQRDLGVGQHSLPRHHFADEVAGLERMTRIALQAGEFMHDAETKDLRGKRKRFGRHVWARLPIDRLDQGDNVTTLDLGGEACAPTRDEMPANHLLDPACRAQLGGGRALQARLRLVGEGVRLLPSCSLAWMHAGDEIADCCSCELAGLR